MKRRDLVLDFTSLLDVIMIILFVVISSMGQASFNAKEEAKKQIEDTQQSLKNLQNKYNEIGANNEELQKQIEELVKENNLYKTEEIDKVLLYEKLMEESKKITLIRINQMVMKLRLHYILAKWEVSKKLLIL